MPPDDNIFSGPPPSSSSGGGDNIFAGPPPEKHKFGLMDTWPVRLAKSLYEGGKSAFTLPGDVASGKAVVPFLSPQNPGAAQPGDPRLPESQRRVIQAATMMSPGARAMPMDSIPRVAGKVPWETRNMPAAQAGVPGVRDIASGAGAVGQALERGGGPVVEPGAQINAELKARQELAQKLRDEAAQRATQEAEAASGIQADQGKALRQAIQGGNPEIAAPREAGEVVGRETRAKAQAGKQTYEQQYRQALDQPGKFAPGAFQNLGKDIEQGLARREQPMFIDPQLTPAARRAIDDLHFTNIAEISMRDAYQQWKRINSYYKAASTPSDRAAVNAVREQYITHLENKITEGLFSGEPKVLGDLKNAARSFATFKKTFTSSGAGDDVGFAMRKITERNASPEEIANMVMGSKSLAAGTPVRLLERLKQVNGAESQSFNAIRQALLKRHDADAKSLIELAKSSLGQTAFTAEERHAMLSQAKGMRDIEDLIATLPAQAKAERYRAGYEKLFGGKEIGGAQGTVFRRIIDGSATPEETARAIFDSVGSASAPQVARMIKAIENITGADSAAMQAVRSGTWEALMKEVKTTPERTVKALGEFLNGRGRTIAESIYDPQELLLMRRFHGALEKSKTDSRFLSLVRKYQDKILAGLGFATHGPMGAAAGYGAGKFLDRLIASRPNKRFMHEFNKGVSNPPGLRRLRVRVPLGPIIDQRQQSYGGTE